MDGASVFISTFVIINAAQAIGKNSVFMPDIAKAKVAGVNIFDIL